jgi:hypothetical protein
MLEGFFYGQKKLPIISFSYNVPIRKDNIYMKQNISKYHFIDWFLSSDTYKNNFSYNGLNSLFDYFEELEEQMEKEMDFDPIAICCEFSEYENLEEIKNNYSSVEINNIDDLKYHTEVIEIKDLLDNDTNRLIIKDF